MLTTITKQAKLAASVLLIGGSIGFSGSALANDLAVHQLGVEAMFAALREARWDIADAIAADLDAAAEDKSLFSTFTRATKLVANNDCVSGGPLAENVVARSSLFLPAYDLIAKCLVQDGEPYCGSRGAALVIGNGPTRRVCGTCGEVTMHVLEDMASGPGIAAAYGTSGGADEVLLAAAGGDARAIAVIDHAAFELGQVLALLVNSLDPEALIVGGGLGCAPGRYWDRLQAAIHAGLWERDERMLVVHQAALGTDAGLIGAALGTIDHTKNRANGHTMQGNETTGLPRSRPQTAKGSSDYD